MERSYLGNCSYSLCWYMCSVSWHFKCSPKIFFGAASERRRRKKRREVPPRISRSWSCLKSRDAIVLDYYYTKGRRDNNTTVERSSPASIFWELFLPLKRTHSWKITQIRRLNLKYISRPVPLWRFMVAFVASTSKNKLGHRRDRNLCSATYSFLNLPTCWNSWRRRRKIAPARKLHT